MKELKEVGKSIDPNFDLLSPKSVGSANKENFFNAIKYCLGLYDLAITQELVDLAKKLKCKIPTLHDSYLRSDITDEKKHATLWHQDGPNIMGSSNAVCTWIPCTDVSKESGTIEIIEKSHIEGVLKSEARPGQNPLTTHGLSIDEKNLPKERRIVLDLKRGEFLVFNPLLIHRSYYPESSSHTRITAIIRYDDASDEEHRKKGFVRGSDNKNINSAPGYK